jgi:class I fructose-bisphosphate aldolase
MSNHPQADARLAQLFPDGKAMFLAYDQGLEHGPSDFHGENVDPAFILKIAEEGTYDGVIFHRGIAEQYYADSGSSVPLILKLNGKTALHDEEPKSLAVASIEDAMELGASAVGYTVYVGSEHEAEMMAEFGKLAHQAHDAGLPVLAWMYPRGSGVKDPHDPDTIAYAARVGLEIGADVVKIYYPGSAEKVSEIVALDGKTKVVIAGGVRAEADEFIDQVTQIVGAGAAGVAVGRNVWQAKDPVAVSRALRKAIHG